MKPFANILNEIGMTDKNTRHTYGHVYEGWFQNVRQSARNILEVGVCLFGGGCVLALAAYFPNATIWAADIDDSLCCVEVMEHPRIKFLKCDAYAADFTERLMGTQFDIIIDDGSHEIEAQVSLLKRLSPFLADDGFYCVEDCVTSQWFPFLGQLHDLGLSSIIVDMSTIQQPDNTIIRWDKTLTP